MKFCLSRKKGISAIEKVEKILSSILVREKKVVSPHMARRVPSNTDV